MGEALLLRKHRPTEKQVEQEHNPKSGEGRRVLGAAMGSLTRTIRAVTKAGKPSLAEVLEQMKHLQVEKLPKRHQRAVQERIRELQEAFTTHKEEGEEEGGEEEGGEGEGKGYVVKRAKRMFEGRVGDAGGEVKEVLGGLLWRLEPLEGEHLVNSRCEGAHTLFVFLLARQRSASDDTLTLMMLWRFNPKHIEDAVLGCFSSLSSKLIRGRGPPFRWVVGGEYLIRYRPRKGSPSWRRIRVLRVTKKHVTAYCYKRNAVRCFKRKRTAMEQVTP
ncbi:MAG: hypothetical protein ACTSP1_00405 [Candidatus Freyarchaeota archaeon]